MIANLFKTLLVLLPLVFYKNTSELFEFNKIITLYIFTLLIVANWAIESIRNKKFIFRRTILDIPLVIFLLSMFLSSLFSIDPRTSWFGYYSRFNGGLISTICYALLYWVFVSSIKAEERLEILKYSIYGVVVASVLAVLEHFGTGITCGLMGFGWSVDCWVQDVQNRVFSTFGQPNWLAAALVALSPFSWMFTLNSFKEKSKRYQLPIWAAISVLFFMTLLFTKSRSGLLAFGVEALVFWGFVFWKNKFKHLKEFLILNLAFVVLFFAFSPFNLPKTTQQDSSKVSAPALEGGGGTDSGEIRKNVWRGAIEIWKRYPLFGTGVETYAFAFPMFKPIEHNLVSEWDFIYNKAHNEFLNYLATTGTVGFLSYISLIAFSIFQMLKKKDDWLIKAAIFSGYISILITNFFGFSVVHVSTLFFIFPAISVVYSEKTKDKSDKEKKKITDFQFTGIVIVCLFVLFLLIAIFRYWLADFYYNKAKNLERSNSAAAASEYLAKALKISPNEPLYITELAVTDSDMAVYFLENKKPDEVELFAKKSIDLSKQAISLAPYNHSVRKTYIGILGRLFQFNKGLANDYIGAIQQAMEKAPNDPKLYYQLGLAYLKNGDTNNAVSALEKAIELRPIYKDARFALGLTYKDLKRTDEARYQFNYILEKIDPKDETSKKYLEELN